MSSHRSIEDTFEISVENIGGIDETRMQIDPGTTILAGRNATNRTSLLQAIMAALGSDQATLKADAEEGRVSLTIDGETYGRRLRRKNGSVSMDGDTYLDESDVADLFAFLLEDNEARRAVERNRELRELIMRPVDTEAIQREIEELTAEKRRLEEEIADLDELKDELPDLEAERSRLEQAIAEQKTTLAAKEDEIEAADGAIEETREAKNELDEKLEQLRRTRSELDDVRYDLDTEHESLDSLEDEKAHLNDELESLPETPAGDLHEIDSRLDVLQERKQSITTDISQLQNIIQFNEEMIEGGDTDLLGAVPTEETAERDEPQAPTDELLEDSKQITCWTCGSEVEQGRVTSIVDELKALRQRKLDERADVDDEIRDLRSEKREVQQQQERREELERTLDRRSEEIERAEATIEELDARSEELVDAIASLEETVESLENQEYTELLELHKEANQIEFEIDRLESEQESVESKIESHEARLEERDALEDERADVRSQLQTLRTEIDRIEQRAVESFNEHMDDVLTALEYRNIERVWIESKERDVRDGRRTVSKTEFELHVVRETASGEAYEDTVDHLSESEREVIGLVFALAGYLTHEVHETVPLMLLDSLEALDSERIQALVFYLEEYVDSLVIALLQEDARAFDETDIDASISTF